MNRLVMDILKTNGNNNSLGWFFPVIFIYIQVIERIKVVFFLKMKGNLIYFVRSKP